MQPTGAKMDFSESLLRHLPLRQLDIVFAETICGLHVKHRDPFGIPGLVEDSMGIVLVPPFSSESAPCAIQAVHNRGFMFVRTLGDCGYRCCIFKGDWLLSDVRMPIRGNSMRVLLIAAILAAQAMRG